MNKDLLIEQLLRGIDEILPESELVAKLKSDEKLTIKLGADPTAPDLHLGHSVILNKLKIFQDLGHDIIFIVGDFTASIGDPSGRSKTRPALTKAEIEKNAITYTAQIFKILDKNKTKVLYNSAWLAKKSAKDLIELAAGQSVARMLERDDFAKRYKANAPISIHEFIYPLLQGYDSVEINADVELGGRDQKFNLLMGRELQKKYGKKQQTVFMMPLLEGTDGVKKMSKSLGNTIDIAALPADMYGKLMSISDVLMWRYFDLLSFRGSSEISKFKHDVAAGLNPRDIKMLLAYEIVARFHGENAAKEAEHEFTQRFSRGQLPADIPLKTVISTDGSLPLAYVLKQAELVASTSDGMRMLKQNAVRLNQKVINTNIELQNNGEQHLLQVGKRKVAKVTLKKH
ncbi:MAG: tyrosine--tRNA ligase [Legionellales bacterium]|nr:tyrosine--tRNA ligase [Legionellales bacterium]